MPRPDHQSQPNEFSELERFVQAQEPVYARVCEELRRGRKETHWMWFIFPQMRGLGHSAMAHRYGIASKAEAEAYLEHPVLGPRLIGCTELVNQIEGCSVDEIFGYPDNLKFRSCMELFAGISSEITVFKAALNKYFPTGHR